MCKQLYSFQTQYEYVSFFKAAVEYSVKHPEEAKAVEPIFIFKVPSVTCQFTFCFLRVQ